MNLCTKADERKTGHGEIGADQLLRARERENPLARTKTTALLAAPHGENQIATATRETRNKSGGRQGNKVGRETETPQAATRPGHREQKS
jgi:hypothetical protein